MVSRPDDPDCRFIPEPICSANDKMRTGVSPHCSPNGAGITCATAELIRPQVSATISQVRWRTLRPKPSRGIIHRLRRFNELHMRTNTQGLVSGRGREHSSGHESEAV